MGWKMLSAIFKRESRSFVAEWPQVLSRLPEYQPSVCSSALHELQSTALAMERAQVPVRAGNPFFVHG